MTVFVLSSILRRIDASNRKSRVLKLINYDAKIPVFLFNKKLRVKLASNKITALFNPYSIDFCVQLVLCARNQVDRLFS